VRGGRADDGAGRKPADDASGNRAAAMPRLGRCRRGDSRDSKGRGSRKISELCGIRPGFRHGLRHGAPSIGSLSSYAFNDYCDRFLRALSASTMSVDAKFLFFP